MLSVPKIFCKNAIVIVDFAFYKDGQREEDLKTIEEIHQATENREGFAWIGLAEPNQEELTTVLGSFKLHETAIEDAVSAQQRAKIEEYNDITTFVIRTVFYDDAKSAISTGELICFINKRFIIIVRHGSGAPLVTVRHELESQPKFLQLGPLAVLFGVINRVIDDYSVIAMELEKDIVQIENSVFSSSRKTVSREIYSLKREVIEYRHAIEPLILPLQRLTSEGKQAIPEPLKPFFRDIMDQVLRSCEHASGMDSLLTAALQADLAQVQVQQNNDVRMISAWVALAAGPTMVAGIYGMNFDFMPELRWKFGYPSLLLLLSALTLFLFRKFKKSRWL
jgi:magnesium transporter